MRQRIRKAGLRAALLAPAAMLSLLLMSAQGPAAAAQPDWPFVHDLWSHSQARGRIGVVVQRMTPELREFMKAPADRGVLVTRVEPERPAAKADLRVGDVIVAAAGDSMEKPFDLVRAVAGVPTGGAIELEIVREGEEQTLSVEPEDEAMTWMDPDRWGAWMERGLHRGSRELRHHIHELERRLEQLERRFDDELGGADAQKT